MQKFIKIDTATRIDLLKEFAVSEKTLYNALNFLTSGYTADSIRRRAKELGGVLFQAVETAEEMGIQHCPDCSVAKYPPCSKGIACCKCDKKADECNSWQSCPKSNIKS